jgi:hypothetical protein
VGFSNLSDDFFTGVWINLRLAVTTDILFPWTFSYTLFFLYSFYRLPYRGRDTAVRAAEDTGCFDLCTMALAEDSFGLLAKEVISMLSSARDWLAVVGTAYAARKTFSLLYALCKTFGTYGASLLSEQDLVCQYGKWAGLNFDLQLLEVTSGFGTIDI